MASKYAHVVTKLAKTFAVEPSRQQKLDDIKRVITGDKSDTALPFLEQYANIRKKVAVAEKKALAAIECGLGGGEPNNARHYLDRYIALRRGKEALEEMGSVIGLVLEAYSQLFVDQAEAEGTSSLKTLTGQTLRIDTKPYPSVKDKDALRQWCLANGLERSMALPWQTLASTVNELLLNGEALPDGVEVFAKPSLNFTDKDN